MVLKNANRHNLVMPVDAEIANARRRFDPNILQFPRDLGPHAIVMNFKEHTFNNNDRPMTDIVPVDKTAPSGRAENTPLGSVVLPLPSNLEDNFNVQLNPSTQLNISGALIAQYSELLLREGVEALSTEGKSSAEVAAIEAIKSVRKLGISGLNAESAGDALVAGARAAGENAEALARAAVRKVPSISVPYELGIGQIVNPHIAVTFEGMNLKRHNFQWTFSPSTRSETETLRNIQIFMKRNSLPQYGSAVQVRGEQAQPDVSTLAGAGQQFNDRIMLKYPAVVDIFFVGIDQQYYYYFKRCMIEQLQFNFNPTGQHTIMQGGRPAMVTAFMSLVETEIHTADDYQDNNTAMSSEGDL